MSTTSSDPDPGGADPASPGLPAPPGAPGVPAAVPGGPPPPLPTRYAQEQPPELGTARRTSPLTVGIELAALGLSFLFELITRRTGGAPPGSPWDPGMATLPLLFLGPRILGWWFRTYTLTESHLALDEGILNRRHRVLPYNRVQQVDLHQNLVAQFFRLAALRIETAGEGGSGAVSLALLPLDEAESLRRFVLGRRDRRSASGAGDGTGIGPDGAGAPDGSAPPAAYEYEYELARMSVGDLLLSALTEGPSPLVAVAAVLGLPWGLAAATHGETRVAVVVLSMLALLAVGTTLLRVVLRLTVDWGWVLTARGDDLHLRAGSLQVRQQSLPRRRVQQVSVVDNPLRRMFGLTSVVLHTAVPAGSTDGISTLVEVPLLRRDRLDDVLRRVMGPEWTVPPLQRRGPAAARRAVLRRAVLLLPSAVGPGLVWGGSAWVAVVFVLLAVPWGRAAHGGAGYATDERLVALASGVLYHRVDLVPLDRIQSARVRSSPFQRRCDLATFHVDVAGSTWRGPVSRSPHLFDVDAATADRLHRHLPT